MSDYWKTHYDLASKEFSLAPLKQVGKTVNGHEVPESQLAMIETAIVDKLRLGCADSLLDLCCGNGLITRRLAPLVRKVVGVDFTRGLIETAKEQSALGNMEYVHGDVLHLDSALITGAGKVLMYEALQHFTKDQFAVLLAELGNLANGSRVMLGSIPDREKLNVYYDTAEKYAFYLRREQEGRPHIGQWWTFKEIEQAALMHGFTATYLPQVDGLYTAYYRFDALLEKQV